MPPLYLIQQNTKIRIRNRRVVVEDESGDEPQTLVSIPLAQVEQVILFGNIGLTTPAINAFLEQGSEVIFLTVRGEYRGRLVGSLTPHVPLRRQQYTRLNDNEFVLKMAKQFVLAKLEHQRTLLLRHHRQRQIAELEGICAQLQQACQTIAQKTALSSLLGLEGSATQTYFRGFRHLIDPRWRFEERNRRPPRDPVNVLLSFGYTLLAEAAASAVQTVGLDPYAGFLHEVAYNRPALGLDLMEEFRPVVDGVVLWCLNSGAISPEDFEVGPPQRPVVLKPEGQRRFLQAYEQRLETHFTHPIRQMQLPLRQCLIEQARQIAHCIQEGNPIYTPMGFR
jgi:CRISPR-associated protein Cas1